MVLTPQPLVSVSGLGIATISGALNRQPTYVNWIVQGVGDQVTFQITEACAFVCGPRQIVPEAGPSAVLLALALTGLAVLRRVTLPNA